MNSEKTKALLKGVAKKILQLRKYSDHTGGTNESRYCYSIWLRHLVFNHNNTGLRPQGTLAELGPGDSPGIGLAALLSGFDHYKALDVYQYWDKEKNLKIFDELVEMFRHRLPIPGNDEYPRVTPTLMDYDFPSDIITDEVLNRTLQPNRIAAIRLALQGNDPGKIIQSFIPWTDASLIETSTIDFIISQAVLQYVDDLDATYQCMYEWLKPGATMSHSIDFSAHGITASWNGHWTFSDAQWRLAHGNNKIILNRAPLSVHTDLLKKNGFAIVKRMDYPKESRFSQKDFNGRFRLLSDEDAKTFVSVLIARKMNS